VGYVTTGLDKEKPTFYQIKKNEEISCLKGWMISKKG
jgi:hypothetical protein